MIAAMVNRTFSSSMEVAGTDSVCVQDAAGSHVGVEHLDLLFCWGAVPSFATLQHVVYVSCLLVPQCGWPNCYTRARVCACVCRWG